MQFPSIDDIFVGTKLIRRIKSMLDISWLRVILSVNIGSILPNIDIIICSYTN